MNRTTVAFALVAALALPALAEQPKHAGKWSLDKKATEYLPPHYAQIQEERLTVKQENGELLVDVERIGDRNTSSSFVYKLDGTANKMETAYKFKYGVASVSTILELDVKDEQLHLTISRNLGEKRPSVVNEKWSVSPDGQTLTVDRSEDKDSGGRTDYTLVFKRVKE